MSLKVVLLFVAAFVVFQCMTWEANASIVRRDADTPEPDGLEKAAKDIQDALNDFQAKMQDLATQIQNDPLMKNITDTVQREVAKLQEAASPKTTE